MKPKVNRPQGTGDLNFNVLEDEDSFAVLPNSFDSLFNSTDDTQESPIFREVSDFNSLNSDRHYEALIEDFVNDSSEVLADGRKETAEDSKRDKVRCMLIRTGPPYHELIVRKVCKGVYDEDIITLTPDTIKELRSKLQYKPFFSKYYVVKLFIRKLDKDERKLIEWLIKSEYIRLLVFIKDSTSFINAKAYLNDQEIKFYQFNSYLASKDVRTRYVKAYLASKGCNVQGIAKTSLGLLVSSLRGYTTEVNGLLTMLANKPITPKNIRTVLPKRNKLTVSSFGYRLMCQTLTKEEAYAFILERKYNSKGLVQSVLDYCDKLIKWHELNMKGDFTAMNVRWIAEQGKKFDIPNQYVADKILGTLKVQSYQKVLLIVSMLCGIPNRYGQLVQLYKVVQIALR